MYEDNIVVQNTGTLRDAQNVPASQSPEETQILNLLNTKNKIISK